MPDTRNERRANLAVRAVFPAAFATLRPFFGANDQWAGQSHEHLAYHALKEQFPDLSAQDAFIVVSAARRLYASGKFPMA